MKTWMLESNDELNQIEVTGVSLADAIQNAKESSWNAIQFFEEYSTYRVELIG